VQGRLAGVSNLERVAKEVFYRERITGEAFELQNLSNNAKLMWFGFYCKNQN
jgi:hypothetical protein